MAGGALWNVLSDGRTIGAGTFGAGGKSAFKTFKRNQSSQSYKTFKEFPAAGCQSNGSESWEEVTHCEERVGCSRLFVVVRSAIYRQNK